MRCGIDLGSRSVKLVLVRDGNGKPEEQLALSRIYETVAFYREFGQRTETGMAVDFPALDIGEIDSLTATGYGRQALQLANAAVIPELKAHVLGAVWQTGLRDFTLLDLGGQDSKVIKVRKGRMVDFQTNDKCAASTGRYLENMAAVLGINLDELAQYSDKPVELSSTCAIFGESELVGRIVEGYPLAELAAGVNHTIYRRIRPLLRDLRSDIIVFTGGVALGPAIGDIISREMSVQVVLPPYPQLNGAIGCAVYAGK
ncbi:MAG TPA: acyl-CoA dehydratase activase [Patescibacteria group bacterium]|nr:acyl-CoA dehydratase activase [Patescibacteria group bacterium]